MIQKIELLSQNESIPKYSIVEGLRIILSYESIIPRDPITRVKGILSLLERIAKSKQSEKIFMYFLSEKVISSRALISLGIPQATVHRIIAYFLDIELIEIVSIAPRIRKMGGPRPKLYGLKDNWNSEDVIRAIFHLRKLKDKGMVLVEKATQLILDEYGITGEINWKDLIKKIKPLSSGYIYSEISENVAFNLQQKGMKVWR